MCFVASNVSGQDAYKPELVNPLSQSWRWTEYPELTGQGIKGVFEGSDHRIWVPCDSGILEYEGYSWTKHRVFDKMHEAEIHQVFETSNGRVVATGSRGIYQLSDEGLWNRIFSVPENITFVFTHLTEVDGIITASSNRGVVMIYPEGDVYLLSSQRHKEINERFIPNVKWLLLPNGLDRFPNFRDISFVLKDRIGRIWLALTLPDESGLLLTFTDSDIKNRDIGEVQIFSSEPGAPLGESQKLLEANDGSIWIVNTTFKSGITVIKNGKRNYIKLRDHFSVDEHMTDIAQTEDGTIWVATFSKLYTFANGQWRLYKAPNVPIPANRILLHKSQVNKIWIVGYKSSLIRLDISTDKWLTYKGLNYQCSSDNTGDWFISEDGAIVNYNYAKWTKYTADHGVMDAPVRLICTSQNQIWAAGSHQEKAATSVLKGNRWQTQRHDRVSWGIDYRAVMEDKSGRIWFGAAVDSDINAGEHGGLIVLNNPMDAHFSWTYYPKHEKGLYQSNAYGIGQSPDGDIWIGGGQLFNFDGSFWHRQDDILKKDYFNQVTSNDRALYCGSRYYGLLVFDGNEWIHHDKRSGLAGNTVISVVAPNPERVYVATNHGVSLFDGRQWTSNVLPEELQMEVEGGMLLFNDEKDELWINISSREWKRRAFPHSPSLVSSSDFITYRYKHDTYAPETELLVHEEKVGSSGNTILSWKGNDYFSNTRESSLLYSWRLNTGEWSPFTSNTNHTFSNLSSGKYTFEVRARDLDLNIDQTSAHASFLVLPPIYKRGWFICLITCFLFIVGYMEYRILRKNQILHRLNLSLYKANNGLKERNSRIEFQNREILQQQEKIVAQSDELMSTNKDLAHRNNEINQQRNQLAQLVAQVEDLSKTKLRFFTNIAHELRTPLSLIEGPLHRLSSESNGLRPENRNKLVEIMQRNVARLSLLSNQILEMRKIESGSFQVAYTSVRVQQYIADVIMLFEDLARQRQIKLTFIRNKQIKIASLDVDKISKILVNLLSNAFKNTEVGGQITIETHLSGKVPTLMEISVENSGQGLTQEETEHIFDRYYSSGLAQTGFSGYGIGLSYTRDLIETINGSMSVKSIYGKSTTFIVRVPYMVSDESEETNEGAAIPASEQRGAQLLSQSLPSSEHKFVANRNLDKQHTVLIVEDNEDMHEFLALILEDDYGTIHASDGEEGWIQVHSHSIDLVISDIMMPGIDGLNFCNRIKSNPSTSHIPVILLSAKAMEDNKMSGFLTGADEYLTKPFNPELLRIRVSNLIQQRHRLQEGLQKIIKIEPGRVKIQSTDEQLLQNVLRMIEDNLGDSNFNVNQMCQMVHLSHMHFIRKIKQLTGKKPIELLKSFRLQRAKDLLEDGKFSVAETAYRVGYNLPNSFSRAFKKEFGYSPSDIQSSDVQ